MKRHECATRVAQHSRRVLRHTGNVLALGQIELDRAPGRTEKLFLLILCEEHSAGLSRVVVPGIYHHEITIAIGIVQFPCVARQGGAVIKFGGAAGDALCYMDSR